MTTWTKSTVIHVASEASAELTYGESWFGSLLDFDGILLQAMPVAGSFTATHCGSLDRQGG